MAKNILLLFFVLLAQARLVAQHLDHAQGELIVQLRPGADVRSFFKKLERLHQVHAGIFPKKELSAPLRVWLLGFDFAKTDEHLLLRAARGMAEVENAQFNHFGDFRQTIPDDPAFPQQWMWLNTGQGNGLPGADIDLTLAWDLTTGGLTADGREIVVCVVEGANRNHPDLQGNLWFNNAETDNDGLDNDGNGYVDDFAGWHVNLQNDNVNDNSIGHGTFVSAMVGAKGNNATMVAGVNWNVKIMHVDFAGVSEANAIAAFTYPLVMRRRYNETGGQQGAFVVATNTSWGIDNGNPNQSPIWCAMYDSLGQAGILNCASTTNDNNNIDIVGDMPTACQSDFLLSVTATNNQDERTETGYGPINVDVAAPGINVVGLNLNGGPATNTGTSFASPMVAGLVALLYAAPCNSLGAQALGAPAATAELVRDAIFQSVDVLPDLVGEIKYGGRINAHKSLNKLLANCGPCPKPFGVAVTSIIDVSATVTWFSTDSTLATTLQYREVGAANWQTVQNAGSPYLLANLTACEDYEFRLSDQCSSENSGFTDIFQFQTDGCCLFPTGITLQQLGETSASISWNPVFAANAYNVLLLAPSGNELFQNIQNTSLAFTGLDSCTNYQVRILSICASGATEYSPPFVFKTTGCGNCTDLDYCPAKGANATEEWIARVKINTLENLSASNGGYGNFTGLSTDLTTYQSYLINLAPGFSGFPYNEWFRAYMDFNQDGDFDDTDELVFDAGSATNMPVQGQVFVPGDALPGITRMRVIMKWNGPPAPCESSFANGEVEDYCVNILEGTLPDCQPPDGLATLNIGPSSADFSWKKSANALSYEVRLKATDVPNWQVIVVPDTFLSALNLVKCTDYEYQARTVCAATKSAWSASTFFETDCVIGSASETGLQPEWTVFPNPFSDILSVSFRMKTSGDLTLELMDTQGRILHRAAHFFGPGDAQLDLTPSVYLPNGVYFIKLATTHFSEVKRVLRVKD